MSHYAHLTVRGTAVAGFSELCRTHGVDALALLRGAMLPADVEAHPDRRLPINNVLLLLNYAASACGCEDFGIQLVQTRSLSNMGPLGMVVRDEPTVGAAVAALEAYMTLHNDGLVLAREYFDDMVLLRATVLGAGPKAHAYDITVAMLYRIVRQLTDASWQPEEILLSRSAPADDARYRQTFGTRVSFGASCDGIVLRADLLDLPNRLADPTFRRLTSQTMRLGEPGVGEPMAARVQRLLPGLLAGRRCTASHAARHLGLSRRTLDRQLEAEGTAFLMVLDQAREDMARHDLVANELKLTALADRLGFSSSSAFSTWFRRRFGVAPREWRKTNTKVQQLAMASNRLG